MCEEEEKEKENRRRRWKVKEVKVEIKEVRKIDEKIEGERESKRSDVKKIAGRDRKERRKKENKDIKR